MLGPQTGQPAAALAAVSTGSQSPGFSGFMTSGPGSKPGAALETPPPAKAPAVCGVDEPPVLVGSVRGESFHPVPTAGVSVSCSAWEVGGVGREGRTPPSAAPRMEVAGTGALRGAGEEGLGSAVRPVHSGSPPDLDPESANYSSLSAFTLKKIFLHF